MRVLVLSIYYPPSRDANSPIVHAICKGLAGRGHEVSVITAVPHYRQSMLDSMYRRMAASSTLEDGVDVLRLWVSLGLFPGLLDRVATYSSYHAGSLLAGLVKRMPDVVITISPPITNGLISLLLSKFRRVPHVYVAQDFYPDVVAEIGVLRSRALLHVMRDAARGLYLSCSKVVVVSDAMRGKMIDIGVPADRIVAIPNFTDTGFIRPGPRSEKFLERLGLADKFIVLFSGNIGLSQPLEPVLDAAELLRERIDIHFALVGSGAIKDRLVLKAKSMGLRNVSFHELLPREDVPELYRSADVCLVPLRRGMEGLSFPSKIYSIMAAGKPVIASVDPDGDVARFVRRVGCGRLVDPEDARGLADAVLDMSYRTDEAREMGVLGREYVIAHHSVDASVAAYESVLLQATEGACRA